MPMTSNPMRLNPVPPHPVSSAVAEAQAESTRRGSSLLGFASPIRAICILVAVATFGLQWLMHEALSGTSERRRASAGSRRASDHPVYQISLCGKGERLLTRAHRLAVTALDVQSGTPLRVFHELAHRDSAAIISGDGRLVALGTFDGLVAICDLERTGDGVLGTEHGEVVHDASHIAALAFSPDSQFLASGSSAGIALWDARSGILCRRVPAKLGCAVALQFTPDGSRLVAALDDGRIGLWTLGASDALEYLNGSSHFVRSMCVVPGAEAIVTGSLYGKVQVWDLANPQSGPRTIKQVHSAVMSVAVAPDAKQVTFGDYYGRVYVVCRESGATIALLNPHDRTVSALAYHPNGRELFVATHQGVVTRWRTADYVQSATHLPVDLP